MSPASLLIPPLRSPSRVLSREEEDEEDGVTAMRPSMEVLSCSRSVPWVLQEGKGHAYCYDVRILEISALRASEDAEEGEDECGKGEEEGDDSGKTHDDGVESSKQERWW